MTEPGLDAQRVRYLYGALKSMRAVVGELPANDYLAGRRDQINHVLDMLDELTAEAREEQAAIATIMGGSAPR